MKAGHLLTVTLPSGDEQLVGLAADLAADGAGKAVAQLGSPIREAVANNASVEVKRPWALMRATMGAQRSTSARTCRSAAAGELSAQVSTPTCSSLARKPVS